MLFNSVDFLFFFPVVTILYFVLPARARWIWLLAASCWFYGAFIPGYLLVLALLIAIDYFAGLAIDRSTKTKRRAFLALSLAANLGLLGVFKYFNFVSDNLAALLGALHLEWAQPHLHWVLPIGLSFHTFQSMSYTIEVYRRRVPAERHLGIYALYVMFYPQLVAGPIERPQHLLPQLREHHTFDAGRLKDGLGRMAWGLFKKVVIADRLAVLVNGVYARPDMYDGTALLVATYFFAIQIYCDFSGYSDIAIGVARVMGFTLMENFRRPYFAGSVADFWHRWHISLSSWFREYVYLPLGGNRVSPARWCVNVMAVFALSGLWHGANWTFVVWGALHGAYLIAERWLSASVLARPARVIASLSPKLWTGARVFVTFHLVCIGWIFFRANSVGDAWFILTHAFPGARPGALPVNGAWLATGLIACALLFGMDWAERRSPVRLRLMTAPRALQWAYYSAMFLIFVAFGMFDSPAQFIYFQF